MAKLRVFEQILLISFTFQVIIFKSAKCSVVDYSYCRKYNASGPINRLGNVALKFFKDVQLHLYSRKKRPPRKTTMFEFKMYAVILSRCRRQTIVSICLYGKYLGEAFFHVDAGIRELLLLLTSAYIHRINLKYLICNGFILGYLYRPAVLIGRL